MSLSSSFKKEFTFQQRFDESARIRSKYPDRIPIILEKANKSQAKDIDKKKYLVPDESTISYFLAIIRKRIQLSPEQGLFLFVNNTLPKLDNTMAAVYKQHKDEDGFLYLVYGTENTFGSDELENEIF